MASVKDIISGAYRYTGLLGDSSELDGTRAEEAVGFLNQIINRLTLDNYVPFAQYSVTVPAGANCIRFHKSQDTTAAAPDSLFQNVFDVDGEPPVSVIQTSYHNASVFRPIKVISLGAMTPYTRDLKGIPYFAAYSRVADTGFLYLNRTSDRELRILANRNLANVDLTDDLDAPPEYIELYVLELALKLAHKYSLPEEKKVELTTEKNDIKNAIKERNQQNDHMIVYDDDPDYDCSFENILSPREWA